MSYKHILVTVNPSEESSALIDKAVMIATATGAELSFICTDEVYRMDHHNVIGLTPNRVQADKEESMDLLAKLDTLKKSADYPIKNVLIGSNNITDEVEKAIKEEGVDLVVCGHHHDFWHSLFSSASELMKNVNVDLFVVSMK